MITSPRRRPALVVALAIAVSASAPSLAASTPSTTTTPKAAGPSASARALLDSHELWATIDVCNAPDKPNTVGVRGSMPGDGRAHDKLFMSFRLQYLNSTTKVWMDISGGATPAFVAVGAGASARQGGSSFQLVPVAGKPAVTLRGVVDFQWRRGGKVLLSAARPTTAGRNSLAGADPKGYSAASCSIG